MGGNLPSEVGLPQATISQAIDDLADANIKVIESSRLYRTPCFPVGAGPDFVNAAVLCQSRLQASEILRVLNQIERKHGRLRTERWGPRTLDIDLLAIGDQVLPDKATFEVWRRLGLAEQENSVPDALILPHPRLQERAFVLIPLAEIAPEWCHPVLECSVSEMLAALPDSEKAGIWPL
jgi:2-amino-4-hydroxy-6-hydroxymethyldihydropteridine diphosphokinase